MIRLLSICLSFLFLGILTSIAQSEPPPELSSSLIQVPGLQTKSIEIRWLAKEGNQYEIQARSSLSDPWSVVATGLKSELDGILKFQEPTLAPAKFFRLLESKSDPNPPKGNKPDFHAGRIKPQQANLKPGQTINFRASFDESGPIDWFLVSSQISSSGNINPNGLYSAPAILPDPPFIFVMAINRNKPEQRAVASILITSPEQHRLTRDQATEILISGVINGLDNKEDVIAFGLQEPLEEGDQVRPFNPNPNASQSRLSGPCWFFMVDESPFSNWAHPALFVSIDCRTGEIKSRNRQNWYPLVNGQPVYNRSTDRFSSHDRVFLGSSAQRVVDDVSTPAMASSRPIPTAIEDEDIPPIPRMFPALPSSCECPDGRRKYGLIGVMSPEEPRLMESGRDMKKILESVRGGRFNEVTLFSDTGTDRLNEEFERLRRIVRPCDVVVLMLLGHGGNGGVGDAKPGDVIAPFEKISTTSRYFILDACDAEAMITQFEMSGKSTPQTTILTASGTARRWPGTNKFIPLSGQSPILNSFLGIGLGSHSGFTDALIACFSRYDTLPEVHKCLTSVTDIGPFALRIAAAGPILKSVGAKDSDLDGILDRREEKRGLDPMQSDSDGDGVCDGIEHSKLSLDQVNLQDTPLELEEGIMAITTPDNITDAVAPSPYEYQFKAIGGIPFNNDPPSLENPFGYGPSTGWTLLEGSNLPNGLTFDRKTGKIAGTPIEPGLYELNLQYMDAIGAKVTKTVQLEVRHPGTEGATILVTTGADGNIRDDDMSLREAIMVMTGELSLADLRPDPDPSDRVGEGERRFVSNGLPGRDSKDFVDWATTLFPDGLNLNGPIQINANNDRIEATNVAIQVKVGPAFEISGNNNHIENTLDIIAASGPALKISGNGNIIAQGSTKTSNSFSNIEGSGQDDPAIIITGHGNRVLGPELKGFGIGVLLKEGASNNTLHVVRCVSGGIGVQLTDGANNNLVDDCLIGFQFDRRRNHVIQPNQGDGILIDNKARNNTLVDCWIGANGGAGVRIKDPGTSGNLLRDVNIGTIQGRGSSAGEVGSNKGGGLIIESGATGNIVNAGFYSANMGHGIWIKGENTIGNRIGAGESNTLVINKPGEGNVIHVSNGAKRNTFSFEVESCGGHAIAFVGQGTTGNKVTHHIRKSTSGSDLKYRTEIENTEADAIFIGEGATGNIVSDARIRNCPSGIRIDGPGVRGNQVNGVSISKSSNHGITVSSGATENIIGPDVASDENAGSGIVLKGSQTRKNRIENNNFMIFNKNNRYAIEIIEGSSENVIKSNNIKEHQLGGLRIHGPNTNGNLIEKNTFRGGLFGADVDDSGFGIEIHGGATRNHIIDNNCSSNGKAGIVLRDKETEENVIDGNSLASNRGAGVWIENAASNRIGISTGNGNVMRGNFQAGILISGTDAKRNRIQRNTIGSSFSNNESHGIQLSNGANENIIGGARIIERDINNPIILLRPSTSQRGAGNVIAGNEGDGIHMTGAHGNLVLGNLIGFSNIQPPNPTNLGNGIYIGDGASNNCVGNCPDYPDRNWQFGNHIIGNAGHRIALSDSETKANRLQGKWIFPNGMDRIHISNSANRGATAPQFNLDPVNAVVSGFSSKPGFVEVYSDFNDDKAVYHFTAFVGIGDFVINQLDPVSSVNATMIAVERPLRINSTQLILPPLTAETQHHIRSFPRRVFIKLTFEICRLFSFNEEVIILSSQIH